MSQFRKSVRVREVGPREGFQANTAPVPTELKVQLIEDLIAAGCRQINAISLVHPKAMPHIADAEQVMNRLGPREGITFSAVVPNERGMERAIQLARSGLIQEVLFVHATSEPVLAANGIRGTREDNIDQIKKMGQAAKENGLHVTTFISASFGCSILGWVNPEVVVRDAIGLRRLGIVDELVISDSTGQGDPLHVEALLARLTRELGPFPITVHFHDSRGAGLANVVAAMSSPVEELTIDCSFGGLGGDVPFLPEAAGNICTEDLIVMLDGMSIHTGIDANGIIAATKRLRDKMGWQMHSHSLTVGPRSWTWPSERNTEREKYDERTNL